MNWNLVSGKGIAVSEKHVLLWVSPSSLLSRLSLGRDVVFDRLGDYHDTSLVWHSPVGFGSWFWTGDIYHVLWSDDSNRVQWRPYHEFISIIRALHDIFACITWYRCLQSNRRLWSTIKAKSIHVVNFTDILFVTPFSFWCTRCSKAAHNIVLYFYKSTRPTVTFQFISKE